MIKFIQKEYNYFRKVAQEAKEHPISATALGVTSINAATNVSRRHRDSKYQKEQLKAMEDLTGSLKHLDSRLKKVEKDSSTIGFPKVTFKLKQKDNSYTADYALKGASIGAGIGGISLLGNLAPKFLGRTTKEESVQKKDKDGNPIKGQFYKNTVEDGEVDQNSYWTKRHPNFTKKYNETTRETKMALLSLGCMAVGAALGAIFGAIKDSDKAINKRQVNQRLMKNILDDLKKSGFKEGTDYVRDPKAADRIKSRVCIVISHDSDTLKLVINTRSEPKLKTISDNITRNLPSTSTVNNKITDRFNEINLTTVSSQGDSVFVSSIAERFIREGYPVYLVEVG